MNLFLLRNLYSINMAQSVISNNQIDFEKNIAYLVLSCEKKYIKILRNNIHNKMFKKIMSNGELGIFDCKHSNLFRKIERHLLIRKNIKNVEQFIIKNNIKEIYFNYFVHDFEKFIYVAAKKKKLKINIIGEGLSLGLLDNIFQQFKKTYYLSIILKKWALLSDSKFYYLKNSNYSVDKLFYFFDFEKYSYKSDSQIKIKLMTFVSEQIKDKLKILNNQVLVISNAFEREENIKFEDVVEIYHEISFKFNKPFIKYHPRESKEKIEYLRKAKLFKELPLKLSKMSAEEILTNAELKCLVGFTSTPLLVGAELSAPEVYSYAERILNPNKNIKAMINLTKKNNIQIHFI